MAIEEIYASLCNSCGQCLRVCPADVIRADKDSGKAAVAYPEDCVLCFFCLTECRQDAIAFTPERPSPRFTSWG